MRRVRAALCGAVLAVGASCTAADDDRYEARLVRCAEIKFESHLAMAEEFPSSAPYDVVEVWAGYSELREIQADPGAVLDRLVVSEGMSKLEIVVRFCVEAEEAAAMLHSKRIDERISR